MIDFETEDVIVLDESRCHNTTNISGRLFIAIIDGIRNKNRVKNTGERYRVNGIELQRIKYEYVNVF